MNIDEIYELSSKFDNDKIDLFVRMIAYNNFNEREIELIYWLMEKDEDPRILFVPRFKNLESRCIDFISELIKTNHDIENVKNLFSYSPSIIDRVISYYELGHDLVPLIDIEYSNWYVEFLMQCLYNNIDITVLCGKVFSYDQIYNLSVCMSLLFNVGELIGNPSLTKEGIINYYVGEEQSNKIFIVEGCVYGNSSKLESCVVKAPSPRLANLVACLNSELNPFEVFNKEIDLDGCGLIYTTIE